MVSGGWHILTGSEVERSRACAEQLAEVDWARPLLRAIESNGGFLSANARPLFFELRFAAEIYDAQITPQYEVLAGVDNDRIDFRLPGWLIELVAIDETSNTSEMTRVDDLSKPDSTELPVRFLEIRSDAEDQRHTGAWQMIKLQEKIYAKVFKKGQPHKFPVPGASGIHAILIDARGFNGGSGPDIHDLIQLVYGPRYAHPVFNESFGDRPVLGLFDELTESAEAVVLRERIHCLIFTVERQFGPGAMWQKSFAFWNPFFEINHQEAAKTFPWPVSHKFRAR